jgi:hypothetical protein
MLREKKQVKAFQPEKPLRLIEESYSDDGEVQK